jgi:hypothetical protein
MALERLPERIMRVNRPAAEAFTDLEEQLASGHGSPKVYSSPTGIV